MIYRLLTRPGEMGFGSRRCAVPRGVDPMRTSAAYSNIFEEIPTVPFCSSFRMFRSPLKPYWKLADDLQVYFHTERKELPDIMAFTEDAYVSEFAKSIIQEIDSFNHQFWPISIFDQDWNPYEGRQFYAFHMRRYLNIKNTLEDGIRTDFNFNKADYESSYLPAIQHNKELRERIEKFHFWRHKPLDTILSGPLYIGPEMMETMKRSGITGVKEFTVYEGNLGEYVAHV